MDLLLVVTDVRVVPQVGLLLSPALATLPYGLETGCTVELARPDGARLRARVVHIERGATGYRICIPLNAPVGPGTAVTYERVESGIIVRSTGLPATGPVHRSSNAVPPGLRVAGGSGRMR